MSFEPFMTQNIEHNIQIQINCSCRCVNSDLGGLRDGSAKQLEGVLLLALMRALNLSS